MESIYTWRKIRNIIKTGAEEDPQLKRLYYNIKYLEEYRTDRLEEFKNSILEKKFTNKTDLMNYLKQK